MAHLRAARLRGFFFSSLLIPVALIVACGSRTPLLVDDVDACAEAGAVQACSTACGSGTTACVDAHWLPCQVPVAERECVNDCGAGSQTCSEGAWTSCEVAVATRTCSTICGQGKETCRDGTWQDCDAPRPGPPKLKATVRDFNDTHPDFERSGSAGLDTGIVLPELGADDKPVYAGMPTTFSTSGKQYFDEWYRDVPGVNLTTTISITLTPSPANPAIYNYDNDAFFPIDNQLFGNQGRAHNYHFTLELATQFRYVGGETFRFTGDDDLWIFINRELAINLGGLHSALSGSVDLDAQKDKLGISQGNVYAFNLFFAERHTVASTFHIQTSIAEFATCE